MMSAMLKTWDHTYDASPDAVFEMLADPAFRSAVSEAQHVVSHDVTLDRDGDSFTMVNDQVQDTAGLPSIAKKIVGDTTRAIQREVWGDRTGATVTVDAPGNPSEIRGSTRLDAAGSGTKQTTELEIKVRVPLIGGKLEALLADSLGAAIRIENQVGDAWLKVGR